MRTLSPWMHLLSEIVATETFIIAGASLNAIDLEYFLGFSNPATPRRGRGPSLLIEPNPDVATRSDCERYGLILVQATFDDFMQWVSQKFPSAPSISELLVPDTAGLFSEGLSPVEFLRFFSDFELVAAADRSLSSAPSPFLYGREPEWDDLHQHVDIERQDNATVRDLVAQSFGRGGQPRLTVHLLAYLIDRMETPRPQGWATDPVRKPGDTGVDRAL